MSAVHTDRLGAWLWIVQRASAALLAVCVLAHLATIAYASQGGLTAAEILARTRGNAALLAGYGIFLAAVAVHVPIGLRTIASEWLGWRGRAFDGALLAFALALAGWGARALWGLYR